MRHFWTEAKALNLVNINTTENEELDCHKIRISQGVVRKVEMDIITISNLP